MDQGTRALRRDVSKDHLPFRLELANLRLECRDPCPHIAQLRRDSRRLELLTPEERGNAELVEFLEGGARLIQQLMLQPLRGQWPAAHRL